MERVPVKINITGLEDLRKLQISVSFSKFEYLPKKKVVTAIFVIQIGFPDTVYSYSGTDITGTAAVHEMLRFSLEKAEEVTAIKSRITKNARDELAEIKKELKELLRYGKMITVDLNEMLNRIVNTVSA